jgi:hypothetical protein
VKNILGFIKSNVKKFGIKLYSYSEYEDLLRKKANKNG